MIFKRRKPRASDDAIAARQRAEVALVEARADTPRLRALAAQLRQIQERNHLAEAFEHTLRTLP